MVVEKEREKMQKSVGERRKRDRESVKRERERERDEAARARRKRNHTTKCWDESAQTLEIKLTTENNFHKKRQQAKESTRQRPSLGRRFTVALWQLKVVGGVKDSECTSLSSNAPHPDWLGGSLQHLDRHMGHQHFSSDLLTILPP